MYIKLKKPFDLKIIFNPIDAEDGLITKVNCKNDKNNKFKFILENVFYSSPDILSLDYDEEAEGFITDEWGDETSRSRDEYNELFEANKNIAFNCKDLDLQDFLQLLSDF